MKQKERITSLYVLYMSWTISFAFILLNNAKKTCIFSLIQNAQNTERQDTRNLLSKILEGLECKIGVKPMK
jgi:hypothetical protein